MAPLTKNVTHCRMCQSDRLAEFLNLGETPPADQFIFPEQLSETEQFFPLRVLMCEACGLAQLSCIVSPDLLYCHDYPYESSTTAAGRRHWGEFAATTVQMLGLGPEDLVIDIGSNVGVLLGMFKERGTRVLGVDPAANIAEIANKNGIETLAAFFDTSTAERIRQSKGSASVITGTNVFAHVDNLHDLLKAVQLLLKDDGVFIVEAPYFGELLNNLEYDTIYHEHLSYLSVTPLVRFLKQFGMEIFDVQRRDIHGGSFRVFMRRIKASAAPATSMVGEMLAAEKHERMHDMARLHEFAAAVAQNREDLRHLIFGLKQRGHKIAAVSAPAKGMTLLNYCGIDTHVLDFVTEKSRLKIGRYTPGTRIKVVSDEALFSERPDYVLLLAWNFAEEIMRNLSRFSDLGGKFIIPIPVPRIVG